MTLFASLYGTDSFAMGKYTAVSKECGMSLPAQVKDGSAFKKATYNLPIVVLDHLDKVYHRLRLGGLWITKEDLVCYALKKIDLKEFREDRLERMKKRTSKK